MDFNLKGGRAMRKPTCTLVVVLTLIMICTFAYGADAPGPIPSIPEKFKNIQIIKPESSIPKDISDFSGEWEGVWKYVGGMGFGPSYGEEMRRAKIIIYEISGNKVKLLYGVGTNPRSAGPGGWRDYSSDVTDSQGKKYISLSPPSGFAMNFHLEDGLLKGVQGGNWSIELKRVR